MSDTNLVLRTLYISPELDNQLRAEAYNRRTSKNDVIRSYLEFAIEQKNKAKRKSTTATKARLSSTRGSIPVAKKAATKKVATKKTAKKAATKKNG